MGERAPILRCDKTCCALETGFTLVEALVALTLLTVALVPAFIQASNALTLAGSVRNSLVAAHLAQEGVEVVQAIRDANWFASQPFNQGFAACTIGCRVQWDSQTLQPLSGPDSPLLLDAQTGLYQYSTGTPTIYSRLLTITTISTHEVMVVVTVTWHEESGNKQFAVEEHLYDWLQP